VKYLLDTNLVIDFLKEKDVAIRKLSPLFSDGIAISVITVAEYLQGVFRIKENEHSLRLFINFLDQARVEILPVDWKVAEGYAKLQARFEQAGYRLPSFDLLIASTAVIHNLTLVSDAKVFTKIKGLKLI